MNGNNPLLSFFWDLASNNATTRETTVLNLHKFLQESQKNFSAPSEAKDLWNDLISKHKLEPSEELVDNMEKVFCSDLTYSIKRLIRGLPSSRDGARQGFSLALLQICRDYSSSFPPMLLLKLLFDNTQVSGGMKSQEEKEAYFGKLFGYMVLLKSGLINTFYTTEAEIEGILTFMLEDLVVILNSKSYLREWTSKIICDVITLFKGNDFVSRVVETVVFEKLGQDTPEYLSVRLFMDPSFRPENLSEILKQTSQSHPRVHYIWELIVEQCKSAGEIKLIWDIVDSFFSSGSHEKKYLGLQVFELFLSRISHETISLLFTKDFTRTLFNTMSSKDTFLHKATQHLINKMVEKCKDDAETGYILLLELISGHEKNIDHLVKNKTIEQFLTVLDQEKIEKFVDYLMEAYASNINTSVVLDQLVSLVKRLSLDGPIFNKIIKFFTEELIEKKGDEILIGRFSAILTVILTKPSSRLENLEAITEIIKPNILNNCDATIKKIIEKALKNLKATKTKEKVLFEQLFRFGLILFSVIDATAGVELLEEVNGCYSKFVKKEGNYDVLVDLFASFMFKQSVLWRKIGEIGFKAISANVSEEALSSLIEVVISNQGVEEENVEETQGMEGIEDKNKSEKEETNDAIPLELVQKILEKNPDIMPLAFDEDNEMLDDEEMKVFDEKLVEIFKEKKIIKQERTTLKKNLTHFKCRIIDLIIIFVKNRSEAKHNISLVKPFMSLFRTLSQKDQKKKNAEDSQMLSKLKSLLLVLFTTTCKEKISKGLLNELINQQFVEMTKSRSGEYTLMIVKCVFFLMRTGLKLDEGKKKSNFSESFLNGFKGALDNFMNNKHSRVSPMLIAQLFERFPQAAICKDVMGEIVEYLNFTEERKTCVTLKAWWFATLFLRTKQEDEKIMRKIVESAKFNMGKLAEMNGSIKGEFSKYVFQLFKRFMTHESMKNLNLEDFKDLNIEKKLNGGKQQSNKRKNIEEE
jgi:DNA polymerase phi